MTPEVRTGGRRGYVNGRASASETRAIARGTGARVLGACDNVARIRRKSSGPNNTHNTHKHNTHTHTSEKFSGDGAMTQPSKFGLTLEIRFDTDRDTMTQTVTPCFAIVPQKAICTKTFGVSYKFCARRLARAFGVHGVWRRAFEWRRASRCRARVWDGS